MELTRSTALVTGGAVRIGRAIVAALAARGCRVVIHYDRSAAAAESLVAALRCEGHDAWAVQADLQGEADCAALVEQARAAAGRLDILVNNAAIFVKGTLAAADEAQWMAVLRPNLLVPILLTRAFAAGTRQGQVINLLDRRISGHEPGCIPYVLSKQALAEFTQAAALELAPGIRVNAVAPGPVLAPPGKGAQYLQDHAGRIPLGRRIAPADVAKAVVALLELDNVTGQIVYVDGGQGLLGTLVAP